MHLFQSLKQLYLLLEVCFLRFCLHRSGLIFILWHPIVDQLSVTDRVLVFHRRIIGDRGLDCESVLPFTLFQLVFQRVFLRRSYIWEHWLKFIIKSFNFIYFRKNPQITHFQTQKDPIRWSYNIHLHSTCISFDFIYFTLQILTPFVNCIFDSY